MNKKDRIIVIGAGMAGLTAAHYLKEAGFDPVVVEKDSRPGGRIMSVKKDDDIFDVGAQFTHTNYKITMELVKKFGLESDMVEMQTSDMMMRDGHAHIIPWGSVRIPTVSLWSQFKLARLLIPMYMRRKDLALEGWPGLLDLDKLELSTYALLKLNQECLDYMVRTLMLTYSMSEPEGISVAYFMRCSHMYLTTGAHCFKSGNDILPKTMARDLDVRYETAVKRIICDKGKRVTGVETSAGPFEGSAVISAIPSPELLPLYSDWNAEQESFLREFTYTKMPLVILEGRVRDEVTYFGGVLDRLAGHRTSFITYPHLKYKSAITPNYLQAWPMSDFGDELIDLPDERIIEAVTKDLRKARPEDVDSIESAFVVRHLHQYPQYKVGMLQKLLRFKDTEGNPSGLYFAGDYTEGGLIEGAALSGYKAAQRIVNENP